MKKESASRTTSNVCHFISRCVITSSVLLISCESTQFNAKQRACYTLCTYPSNRNQILLYETKVHRDGRKYVQNFSQNFIHVN